MAVHSNDRYWDDDERAPLKTLRESKDEECDQWGFLGPKLLKSISKISSDCISESSEASDGDDDYFYCREFMRSFDDWSLENDETPVSSEGSSIGDDEYNAEIMDGMIYEKMW
jgi:hypothetical protein